MEEHPTDPTALTDEQWQRLLPFIPPPQTGGRRRTVNLRHVITAILYLLRTGSMASASA